MVGLSPSVADMVAYTHEEFIDGQSALLCEAPKMKCEAVYFLLLFIKKTLFKAASSYSMSNTNVEATKSRLIKCMAHILDACYAAVLPDYKSLQN